MIGVDAIEHTASPVTFDVEDPKGNGYLASRGTQGFDCYFIDIINPAVKGTLGILNSALKSCVFFAFKWVWKGVGGLTYL